MDFPVRKKLPHTVPQWVDEGSWFFITIKCVPKGKNQLCLPDTGKTVLAAMLTITNNCLGIADCAC